MPYFARKMHFLKKNGSLTPSTAQHRADVNKLSFWKVICQ